MNGEDGEAARQVKNQEFDFRRRPGWDLSFYVGAPTDEKMRDVTGNESVTILTAKYRESVLMTTGEVPASQTMGRSRSEGTHEGRNKTRLVPFLMNESAYCKPLDWVEVVEAVLFIEQRLDAGRSHLAHGSDSFDVGCGYDVRQRV